MLRSTENHQKNPAMEAPKLRLWEKLIKGGHYTSYEIPPKGGRYTSDGSPESVVEFRKSGMEYWN